EHPEEAFDYFSKQGIQAIVCEEKHMGSRAVIQICKSDAAAKEYFGVDTGEIGICYTRTGRRFFKDSEVESALLQRLQQAIIRASLWAELSTEWMTLDCELMPWSMKAIELITSQYAEVGAAGLNSVAASIEILRKTKDRGVDVSALLDAQVERHCLLDKYAASYRNYCWTVTSPDDLRLAPFHLLAREGKTYFDQDHRRHMDTLARIASDEDKMFSATPYRVVELGD